MANWGKGFAEGFSKSYDSSSISKGMAKGYEDRQAKEEFQRWQQNPGAKEIMDRVGYTPHSGSTMEEMKTYADLASTAFTMQGKEQKAGMEQAAIDRYNQATGGGSPSSNAMNSILSQANKDLGIVEPNQNFSQLRQGIPPTQYDVTGQTISPTGGSLTQGQTPESKIQQDIYKEGETGKVKALNKWNEEDVQRQIKFDVMTPKMNNYMEVGGRAYQELSDFAEGYGIKLNFATGGLNAYVAQIAKKAGGIAKMTPLMNALDALRPELGVELMRQLGAFRSAQMAAKFENTLSKFSGNIREDIALMTTTLAKNKANVVLLDEAGNPLPNDAREAKMDGFEANLIRKYNFMYRGMGLMDKPYTAQRSFDWLAKNSTFNPKELQLIDNATKDNPKAKREKVIAKLIEKGLL